MSITGLCGRRAPEADMGATISLTSRQLRLVNQLLSDASEKIEQAAAHALDDTNDVRKMLDELRQLEGLRTVINAERRVA